MKYFVLLFAAALLVFSCAPEQPYTAGGTGNDFGPRIAATCFRSHESTADAIFRPTTMPPAHLHVFFGNKTTDNDSTYASLRAGETECKQEDDKSAWWNPAVYWGDQKINAGRAVIYFQPSDNLPKEQIKLFPPGFEAIARGPKFQCGNGDFKTTPFKSCDADNMKIRLTYKQCLNPNSDVVEENLVGPVNGRCPTTHPKQLPEIQYDLTFPLPDSTGPITVAGTTGPHQDPTTFHSDFVNAWNQDRLKELIQDCIWNLNKEDRRPDKCRTSDNA